MSRRTNDLSKFEERVAKLDAQRLAWKWSPENPLPPLVTKIMVLLEQLISIYSNADEAQRSYIRRMMQNHPGVAMYLQAVATGDIRKIRSQTAPERLYPALLAISIANSDFGDYRDLLVMLGSLWLRAVQAGIDPEPYFKSAAALSDWKEDNVHGLSMRDILENFSRSAYFRENILP